MPKNVEIKARVHNVEDLILKVKGLCNGQDGALLSQSDTFYKANNGRLKLREFGVGSAVIFNFLTKYHYFEL